MQLLKYILTTVIHMIHINMRIEENIIIVIAIKRNVQCNEIGLCKWFKNGWVWGCVHPCAVQNTCVILKIRPTWDVNGPVRCQIINLVKVLSMAHREDGEEKQRVHLAILHYCCYFTTNKQNNKKSFYQFHFQHNTTSIARLKRTFFTFNYPRRTLSFECALSFTAVIILIM